MSKQLVLGRVEIADLLEVDKRTPHAWYQRGLLPAPDHAEVNGGPAWDRVTILKWAYDTGRWPEGLSSIEELGDVALMGTPGKRGGRLAKARYGKTRPEDAS